MGIVAIVTEPVAEMHCCTVAYFVSYIEFYKMHSDIFYKPRENTKKSKHFNAESNIN